MLGNSLSPELPYELSRDLDLTTCPWYSWPTPSFLIFESYWLCHPAVFDVVSTAWNLISPDSDSVSLISLKIKSVQSALHSWSTGLSSALREQAKQCLLWIDWLDKAEEGRILSTHERTATTKLLLDKFAACSGLTINYNKSSVTPINSPATQAASLANFI
ncbi:hypothetical protein ACMD2_24156, partial [Ananas comosus]